MTGAGGDIFLSIVIPVFNAGGLLLEAVESVHRQGCGESFEIVIVDDRSTDPATLDTLAQAQDDATVRIIGNQGKRGPGAARNAGVAAARGRWIAFLDADDVWPDGSLERRLRVVRGDPAARWVAGPFLIWGKDGALRPHGNLARGRLGAAGETGRTVRVERPLPELIEYTPLPGTMLLDRELLRRAGGFDEDAFAEDWLLGLALALEGDLHFVPAPVLHQRRQQASLTTPIENRMRRLETFRMALRDPRFAAHAERIRGRLITELLDLGAESWSRGRPVQAARLLLPALAERAGRRRVLRSMATGLRSAFLGTAAVG